MNLKQRKSNRFNAARLAHNKRTTELNNHICENCGEPGGHWISTRGMSLEAILNGTDDQTGFWTCRKYYGEDGRRIAP